MAEDRTRRSAAPRDVCALVVGIETNGFTWNLPEPKRPEAELRGAARNAAQLAHWLLDNGVCRPDRLTLMTAHNEKDRNYDPKLSPEEPLAAVKALAAELGGEVNHVLQSSTQQDFKDWITGPYRPKDGDKQFILFWVGHGLTYPHRRFDPRLCLLGADAEPDQLRHVELVSLLDAVGAVARRVQQHQVALIDACREPVPDYGPGILDAERLTVDPSVPPRGIHSNYRQSIAFAAAPGQTTRASGWQYETFAKEVLGHLDEVPYGQGPGALFDDNPGQGVASWFERTPPFNETAMTFRYLHKKHDWLSSPPDPEFDVTEAEWQALRRIARRLDRSRRKTSRQVRWGALCHAVDLDQILGHDEGPGGATRPLPLRNLEDLFTVLYGWPSREQLKFPSPLVMACDFVANMPSEGARPVLDQWCRAWADRNGEDGQTLLDNARKERRKAWLSRDFLGVLIDNANDLAPGEDDRHPLDGLNDLAPDANEGDRYLLKGFVWASRGPRLLGSRGPVAGQDVAREVADLIGVADELKALDTFSDTVIDLALPRDLIGRRVEYDHYHANTPPLGMQYAVAMRDLDRMRGNSLGRRIPAAPRAREVAAATWQRISALAETGNPDWFATIEWIKCDQPYSVKRQAIDGAIANEAMLGFVLEYGSATTSPSGNGQAVAAPPNLVYSLNVGAAVVVSLQHEGSCGQCPFGAADGEQAAVSCTMPSSGMNIIKAALNKDARRGLLDLPIVIRDIRQELSENRFTVGVLVDDQSPLWVSYAKLMRGSR